MTMFGNPSGAYTTLLLILLQVMKGRTYQKQQGQPFFHENNTNITVREGDSAILKCTIENLGPKLVNWRKLSVEYPLTVGEMIFMENQGIDISRQRISDRITRWDLVIKRVQKTDAGSYECQVSSVVPIKYLIQLNVIDNNQEASPSISITGSAYVNLYQRINLTCNASGIERAPEDIDWFHKGHKISQKNRHWRNRFQIVKFTPEAMGRSLISRLIIDHGLAKDRGVYICRSSDLQTTSIVVHVLNADRSVKKKAITQLGSSNFISDGSRDARTDNGSVLFVANTACLLTCLIAIFFPS